MEKVKYRQDNFVRFDKHLIIPSKLNEQSVYFYLTFHPLVCRVMFQMCDLYLVGALQCNAPTEQ